MTPIQGILIVLLIAAGIGGAVYVNRPGTFIKLGSSAPTPVAQGIADKTIPAQEDDSQGGALNFFGTPPPEFAGYGQGSQGQQQIPPLPRRQASQQQLPEPINETMRATLKTTKGDITIELYGADAPLTVGNFVSLANQNFYDGTAFHRVIADFMIQGGDSLSKDQTKRHLHGTGQLPYEIPDEINDRKLVRGSLGAANRGPNTNGSQFFIVTADATPHLDGRHTNFGQVVEGMDVVDAIANVEKDNRDNPLEPVTIEDVVIAE